MNNTNIAIILTACVNPNGMSQTVLQDSVVRKLQYIAAIKWYLDNTMSNIVVVENTGYDFSSDFLEYFDSSRIEFITFNGNDYDRSKGKGYGEGVILKYAFEHSRCLSNCNAFVKVTGRFIVKNINKIIDNYNNSIQADLALFNGRIYCRSRIFIGTTDYLKNYFLPEINKIDDSKVYYFEHLLYDSALKYCKETGSKIYEFSFPPMSCGVDGSSGLLIKPGLTYIVKWYFYHILHRFNLYRNLVTF